MDEWVVWGIGSSRLVFVFVFCDSVWVWVFLLSRNNGTLTLIPIPFHPFIPFSKHPSIHSIHQSLSLSPFLPPFPSLANPTPPLHSPPPIIHPISPPNPSAQPNPLQPKNSIQLISTDTAQPQKINENNSIHKAASATPACALHVYRPLRCRQLVGYRSLCSRREALFFLPLFLALEDLR